MATTPIYMPPAVQKILNSNARIKILYGGRAGGKSYAVANYLVIKALERPVRIFCGRVLLTNIQYSVHSLLVERIHALNLEAFFIITRTEIKSVNGSLFIFKGLKDHITEIKSLHGANYCWIEEAEGISHNVWTLLIPTIRRKDSEILITFNPDNKHSATYTKFVEHDYPNSQKIKVNYSDNACYPTVLEGERLFCKEHDYDEYLTTWLGEPRQISDALIFKNKYSVREFKPCDFSKNERYYFGTDFGFSSSPLVLIRCFIREEKNERNLYIDKEFFGYHIELNTIAQCYDSIEQSRRWRIWADNSRPDTINYLRQKGFNIKGAEKGPNSIEEGLRVLKAFDHIYLDPDCKKILFEFTSYKYKIDETTIDHRTGKPEILPIIIDKHNHGIDSLRYALVDLIKHKSSIYDALG